MAKDLLNRYIWLVDTVYRAGSISFEEINEKWLKNPMSGREEIPIRTFHNHKDAILELFDIKIVCNKRSNYSYYIENQKEIEQGSLHSWLFNLFSVNNQINESPKLKQRIIWEFLPMGQRFLNPIIEAMRDDRRIKITYQSFQRVYADTFEIEPYCVKIFKKRWYAIARDPYLNKIRIYALDRIQSLEIMDTKFRIQKKFDINQLFKDSFGMVIDEQIDPEMIKVKVWDQTRNYFRGLPLHSSQEEIETAGQYSIFSYMISPTYDFTQELLSHCPNVEVIWPPTYREEIAKIIHQTNTLY
ncbi:MAG: WYL domain-containing protein [Candidatus Symbiothrix sp.]|jgi:hypothetical protein|nr:WYL domain-containing protein [Candidatus Symbiothrix sp.]